MVVHGVDEVLFTLTIHFYSLYIGGALQPYHVCTTTISTLVSYQANHTILNSQTGFASRLNDDWHYSVHYNMDYSVHLHISTHLAIFKLLQD